MNRILSVLLCFIIVFCAIPAASSPAYAATTAVSNFSQLQNAINSFNNSASADTTIVISADFDIMAIKSGSNQNSLTITNKTRTLTITSANPSSPRTLTRGVDGPSPLAVSQGAKLILKDIIIDGQRAQQFPYSQSALILVRGGTLTMEDGAILQNSMVTWGGAVQVDYNGQFIMNGGEIKDNKARGYVSSTIYPSEGAGVYVDGFGQSAGSSFTMNGGTISGNDSTDLGGGVYLWSGSFTMNGGEISGNTADYGAGVYMVEVSGLVNKVMTKYPATFTMNGGTIKGNTARESGGGVTVRCGSFTMNDSALIEDNSAKNGAGVFVETYDSERTDTLTTASLTMNGGTISGNTTDPGNGEGGGIYIYESNLTIKGNASVKDNSATIGGGVFLDGSNVRTPARLYMAGGEIKENAAGVGGGVNVSAGSSIILGGVAYIKENTTGTGGILSNVGLSSGSYITLGTGAAGNGVTVPASGMDVGANTATGNTIVNSGATAVMAGYFHADDVDKKVSFEQIGSGPQGRLIMMNALEEFYRDIAAYGTATADMTVLVPKDLLLDENITIPSNSNNRTLTIKSNSVVPFTLSRDSADTTAASALFTVGNNARLTLENITIDGKKSVHVTNQAPLVRVNDSGIFAIGAGATLKDNRGGGVYVNTTGTGAFRVGGNAAVSGNTDTSGAAYNVYLTTGRTITFGTGSSGNGLIAPASGMSIGIAPPTAGAFTSGSGANSTVAGYFNADQDGKMIAFRSSQLHLLTNINSLALTPPATLTYNGSAQLPTIAIGSIVRDSDYTITGAETDVGFYSATLTGIGLYGGTRTVDYSIVPLPYTNAGPSITQPVRIGMDGNEYSISLAPLLAVLNTMPGTQGAATYSIISLTDDIGIIKGTPTITGNMLTVTTDTDTNDATAGNEATIGIEISTRNYGKYNAIVTLSVMEKDDISDIISFAPGSATYTGSELSHETASIDITPGSSPVWTYAYDTNAASGESFGTNGKPVNAGSYTVVATYSDSSYFGSKTVEFTVNKADPAAIIWPEASDITYGEQLSASGLTGGSNTGVFAWADDAIVPPAGIHSHNVTFTPHDMYNYNWSGVSLTKSIAIKVDKAAGMTATPPAGIIILRSNTAGSAFDLDSIILDKADAGIRNYTLNGGLSGETGVLNGLPSLGGDRFKTLTYPGSGNTEGSATQSITIDSENYESVNVDITFTTPPITDVSHLMTFNNSSATYTGSGLTHENASLDTSGFSPTGESTRNWTYTYTPDSENASLNSAGKPLNAGAYIVDALYEDTDNTATGRATFTIGKATQNPPPAPTLTAISKTSITLAEITVAGATVEYRRDALENETTLYSDKEAIEEWRAETLFEGLEAATGYTFYARLKGDENRYDSFDSAASNTFITAKTDISGLIITEGGKPAKTLSIFKGDTKSFTAEYLPPGEDCQGVTWTTSNERIVSVTWDESLSSLVADIKAETTGTATITVRLNEDDVIYDVCHVTVIPAPPESSIEIISDADRPISSNGRILDELYTDDSMTMKKTLQLQANGVVKAAWKSSDTSVATINAAGLIAYKNSGTTTITATGKSTETNANLSGSVILTIMDMMPKLPVNKVSINSNSSAGVLFTVLPSDTFGFEDVYIKSATLKNKPFDETMFDLSQVDAETYRLLTATDAGGNPPANGTYVLALQAVNTVDGEIEDAGIPFTLTVVVASAVPKPAVKIPALNVFYTDVSSSAPITGAGLPEIERVELKPTGKPADGDASANFTADYIDGMLIITAKPVFTSLNSAKKTAVKGILEVYFKDFSGMSYPLPVTIPIKDTAPKLTLAPASQTINLNYGNEATFGVNGGKPDRVLKADVAANNVISDPVINEGRNSFTIRFNETAKANATNSLQVSVWLEDARRAVVLKPKVVTTTKTPTYKLSAKTVTLNNTLADQVTTVGVIPSIANANVEVTGTGKYYDEGWYIWENEDRTENNGVIVSINTEEDDFEEEQVVRGAELLVTVPSSATVAGKRTFNITYLDALGIEKTLPLTVTVDRSKMTATVKAGKEKIDLVNRKHETSKFVYTPTIKNNAREITGVSFVNPDDNDKFSLELSSDKKAVVTAKEGVDFRKNFTHKINLQFNIGEEGAADIFVSTANVNIKPVQSAVAHALPKTTIMYQSRAGIGNAVAPIDLAPKKPVGATIDKLVIKANPKEAYWYYFDRSEQKLYIWIVDGALTKPGKATLTFEATYTGHSVEANGNPKPALIKIPVSILQ